jgi:alanine racemase|tara:strand:- start:555 stop:677 length:123 start_codon:yes stop_codon:yes gene_type:complete
MILDRKQLCEEAIELRDIGFKNLNIIILEPQVEQDLVEVA